MIAPKAALPLIEAAKRDIVNVSNIQQNAFNITEGTEFTLSNCVFGENEPKVQR